MTPDQVIEHFGGTIAKAAERLKVTRQTLYNWKRTGVVPGAWQAWCEHESGGALKQVIFFAGRKASQRPRKPPQIAPGAIQGKEVSIAHQQPNIDATGAAHPTNTHAGLTLQQFVASMPK
jgi:Bacterial regulatory protein, Fis family